MVSLKRGWEFGKLFCGPFGTESAEPSIAFSNSEQLENKMAAAPARKVAPMTRTICLHCRRVIVICIACHIHKH